MAASERSLFRPPNKKYGIFYRLPNSKNTAAYVTGGLKSVYKKIQDGQKQEVIDAKCFTDETGQFKPAKGMPLMAQRYKFIKIIGFGHSSILIKAQDTFRNNYQVAIKVLHFDYYFVGLQEMELFYRLSKAEPNFSNYTLQLLNTFSFCGHFCITFELLGPSVRSYFAKLPKQKVLSSLRKLSLRILTILSIVNKQNLIHADVKPDNILLAHGDDISSTRLIDFGNAINFSEKEEMALYCEDFDVQTLVYRAPEIMFGMSFGTQIDLWSLGCSLVELYTGFPLFFGKDKEEILRKITSVLGAFPCETFCNGKFYSDLKKHTSFTKQPYNIGFRNLINILNNYDHDFIHFIAGLLEFDPDQRLTPYTALQHPFLAPELALRYFSLDSQACYPSVSIDKVHYNFSLNSPKSLYCDKETATCRINKFNNSTKSPAFPCKKRKSGNNSLNNYMNKTSHMKSKAVKTLNLGISQDEDNKLNTCSLKSPLHLKDISNSLSNNFCVETSKELNIYLEENEYNFVKLKKQSKLKQINSNVGLLKNKHENLIYETKNSEDDLHIRMDYKKYDSNKDENGYLEIKDINKSENLLPKHENIEGKLASVINHCSEDSTESEEYILLTAEIL